jgi:hypothetical protein
VSNLPLFSSLFLLLRKLLLVSQLLSVCEPTPLKDGLARFFLLLCLQTRGVGGIFNLLTLAKCGIALGEGWECGLIRW